MYNSNYKNTLVKKKNVQSKAGSSVKKIVRKQPIFSPRNMIRYNQSRIGGEVKSMDIVSPTITATTTASFTLNSTPQIVVLNPITIGSSSWNRIGRKVSLKSLHMTGYISQNTNEQVTTSFGRYIIVYDKQTNGSLPSFDDMFRGQINGATDSNTSAVNDPFAGLNLNNKERFEIILDRRLELPLANSASLIQSFTIDLHSFTNFVSLGNREVHFKADSTPGVIGDISTGGLYIVTVGSAASGSDSWALTTNIRLRYTDL
nr:MAG: capsid protein [Cressdnaviricota sp.]